MPDSSASGRHPDFDLDNARGKYAEDEVETLRKLCLDGSIEVKRDDRAAETGNVYIETRCLYRGSGWGDSGIKISKADRWAIVLAPTRGTLEDAGILFIPTKVLRAMAEKYWNKRNPASCTRGSHPTKGSLIPVKELLANILGR